jgi:hypothetical protein
MLAVADWWLMTGFAVAEETEAAAMPAKTSDRTKMRAASFIVGNLSMIRTEGRFDFNLR